MAILIATSTNEYDPTEVAVPWKILRDAGYNIVFTTDTGKPGTADQRMLDGNKFGILKQLLIADKMAQKAYCEMLQDHAFQNPIHYDDIRVEDYEGLVLPGGHAKGVIPYLESKTLQKAIAEFFAKDKPVAAICHGVVAACRAKDPKTGKSVLHGRKTTALLKRQELLAYQVTRWNLGDYYLTYPTTVEDEVIENLQSANDFIHGPMPILRDDMEHLSRGFTVRDGNYLSARWPGDIHRFATDFIKILKEA
ncbi:MAG: type 1 glutamine amidotransferase domain-containing protein [Rhizobiaceae bacterium]